MIGNKTIQKRERGGDKTGRLSGVGKSEVGTDEIGSHTECNWDALWRVRINIHSLNSMPLRKSEENLLLRKNIVFNNE